MGQAAVDLPDPLGQEPLDNAPSADDLLAQMAGEEVDRLLAEAELERPGKEAPPMPAAAIDAGATPQQPATPAQEVQTEKTSEPVVSPVAEGANEVARALDAADPDTAQQLDALFAELNASPAEPISIPARASVKTPAEPDKLNETPPPAAGVPMDQQLDDLFAELNASPVAQTPSPASAPVETPPEPVEATATTLPAAEVPVDQQLDDLFSQLTGEGASSPQEPAPASESPVAATAAEAPAAVAASAEAAPVEAPAVAKMATPTEPPAEPEPMSSDKPALDPQEQTGSLEKEVLSAAIPAPIEETEIIEPSKPMAPVEQNLPLWVRGLELFNAPLAAWGDGVREAVGKIAIMTLINAMALLTYVLVFRRH